MEKEFNHTRRAGVKFLGTTQPKKEFNLSEKINWKDCGGCNGECYDDIEFCETKDIKEFIKMDWELILNYIAGRISVNELTTKRDKLAGPKLITK